MDLAAHSPSAIDADGVGKYLERQSPCLVAVQRGAHRQVAETVKVRRQAVPNRALDACLEQRSVLVFEADAQSFREQGGRTRRDADSTLGGQALDLLAGSRGTWVVSVT